MSNTALQSRPPVVAIMGHVDHGKSTLLDTIRNANTVAGEAGGITQHVSAYEVIHTDGAGLDRKITFIDTPGHAAFSGIRARSASLADIAILIVAADDGVKPQTIEALKTILDNNVPFLVAINKIDKGSADVERVIRELMEQGVFLEGYGGDITYVQISAKTGTGIPDLLETILLLTDMLSLTCNPALPASGFVVESHRDTKRGITATLLIKDGTLKKGDYVVAGQSYVSVKNLEDYTGGTITSASTCTPVSIYGFSAVCPAGAPFTVCQSKVLAESMAASCPSDNFICWDDIPTGDEVTIVPVVVKCDVVGSIDAVITEIRKQNSNRVYFKVVSASVGIISESDIRLVSGDQGALIIGFNTTTDARALESNEARNVTIEHFSIIYKMSDWLAQIAEERKFRKKVEIVIGTAQVIRVFSEDKGVYLIGCKVASGMLTRKARVRITRGRDIVARGVIDTLQVAKNAMEKVEEGAECGMMVSLSDSPRQFDILEVTMLSEE